jgi:hypothetical protein
VAIYGVRRGTDLVAAARPINGYGEIYVSNSSDVGSCDMYIQTCAKLYRVGMGKTPVADGYLNDRHDNMCTRRHANMHVSQHPLNSSD